MDWLAKSATTDAYSFLFSINQIVGLIQRYPQLYQRSMNAAREDIWARHHMLVHPDFF